MCRIHCLNKVLLAALRWPASPSRIPSSISSPAILQISSSLRSVLLLSSHFPLQFSKKMINDSQEQGTQSPLFPSGKEHVKHRFPSRHLGLLLEAAELTGECGSVLLHGHVSLSPSFSAVTVLLQLPRFAKTARWKEICPHTQMEQSVWSVSTSTEWSTQACSEGREPQIAWNQGWEVGTEGGRAGWLFWRAAHAQVSLWSLRNQHLGPKVMCSSTSLVGGLGRAVWSWTSAAGSWGDDGKGALLCPFWHLFS